MQRRSSVLRRDRTLDTVDSKLVDVLPKVSIPSAEPRVRGSIVYNTQDDGILSDIWYSDGTRWIPLSLGPPIDAAYAYAEGHTNLVIAQSSAVTYSSGTIISEGFTSVPSTNEYSFVVAYSGVYEFDFYVAGVISSIDFSVEIQFAVFVNGELLGPQHVFRSGITDFNFAYGQRVAIGHGLIELVEGDEVFLVNNTSSFPITVSAVPRDILTPPRPAPAGEVGANIAFSLRRIS